MTPSLIYVRAGADLDLAVRARQGRYNAPTILFIHGLGDSSAAWEALLNDDRLARFTLLAPDLPGYGKTLVHTGSGGGFDSHLRALRSLLGEMVGGELLVVGHSMGGLLGTLLLRGFQQTPDVAPEQEPMHSAIEPVGFVNVEGNLTGADAFISGRAVKVAQRGDERYDRWFREFVTMTREGQWAQDNPQLAHYGESLLACDPRAFLADCVDLVAWKQRTDEETGENAAGVEYLTLEIPKAYVYGEQRLPEETREFLSRHSLGTVAVDPGTHWAMVDDPGAVVTAVLAMVDG